MISNWTVSILKEREPQVVYCVGLLVLMMALCAGLWAQAPAPATPPAKGATGTPEPAQKTTAPEMTAGDVSAFLDGVMPGQLAREDITGAVVLVIKDGKVLFTKGYGYACSDKKTPVLPDGTLFRPGSVSKLFTWTAVMQLVEQGKLDLDRDVNEYLDFKIPPAYGKPITLRNIMTHTSGFEETVKDMWVGSTSDLVPIGDYVKAHVPARIFPPGVTPAYSNYATTVAGYIVQRVSGEDFFDYIDRHILNPLGMQHSTFRQPLPANIKPMMSCGYEAGSEPAKDFELVEPAPAGSSSMTAMDISHFMLAHLQDGKYENVQILKPETAQLMHSRQFANLPSMNAMCLGFYEETRNGHRIFGHGGDTLYFHSDLHLMPDTGVGFFVSYNSRGKAEISPRDALWHAFLDRYFPYEPPAGTVVANAKEDAASVSGHYIVSRRMDSNFLAVLTPIQQLKISPNATDNTIIANELKDLNGQPKHFREIGPLMFRDINGQSLLGFKRDDTGRLIAVIDYPFMVFQRASWYDSSPFNLFLICTSLGIFLITLILWPIGYFVRRHYGKPLNLTHQQKKLRLWTRLACAIDLIFVIVFVTIVSLVEKFFSLFSSRMDIWLHLLQLVGWIGVIGTLAVLWNTLVSWRSPERGICSKIGDTLVLMAAIGYSWFAIYWNLLHWGLQY
ncbi:MAG TPA: serine hydrolase domain-containing protein [Terriglobales bacterium]|nr:serine hydrolase domain-containing protein [Terriglobales bacterium]